MSLIREQQETSKKATLSGHTLVRKSKKDPVKVMLRWVYWLLLVGVILAVVVSSLDAALSLYRGGN